MSRVSILWTNFREHFLSHMRDVQAGDAWYSAHPVGVIGRGMRRPCTPVWNHHGGRREGAVFRPDTLRESSRRPASHADNVACWVQHLPWFAEQAEVPDSGKTTGAM